MKRFILLIIFLSSVMVSAQNDGDLDLSFGKRGVIEFSGESKYFNYDLTSDGKVLVTNYGEKKICRYFQTGEIDSTFGNNGEVKVEYKFQLIIQDNKGRIIACNSDDKIKLIRLSSEGKIDTSFGDSGIISEDLTLKPRYKHNKNYPTALNICVDNIDNVYVLGGMMYPIARSRPYIKRLLLKYSESGTRIKDYGSNGYTFIENNYGYWLGSNQFRYNSFENILYVYDYKRRALAKYNNNGLKIEDIITKGIWISNVIFRENEFYIHNPYEIDNVSNNPIARVFKCGNNAEIDSTFGNNGFIELTDRYGKLLVDNFGRVIIVSNTKYGIYFYRFLKNGDKDYSFGENGRAMWRHTRYAVNYEVFKIDKNNNIYMSVNHKNKSIVKIDGSSSIVSVNNINSEPSDYILSQNYPNPFNPSTNIRYTIPDNSGLNVTLKVYNSLGEEIKTLVNEQQSAGNYNVQFNANDLSSGVYFYILKSGDFTYTKKMMFIK